MSHKIDSGYGRIGTARLANILAYFQFNDDLTDSASKVLDLVVTGTERYTNIGNLRAFSFDGSTYAAHAAHDANLKIYGALSLHVLFVPRVLDATEDVVMMFGLTGATEANNVLYDMKLKDAIYSPAYRSENGAGNQDLYNLTTEAPVIGQPLFWSITRDASSNVQFYMNGRAVGSVHAGTVPTGGGAAKLAVGNWITGGFGFNGALTELQILDTQLSAAQVLEDARKVMPWL